MRWYIGALGFTALCLLSYLFLDRPNIDVVEFLLFLALFLLAESRPVLLPRRRVAVTVTFIIVIVAMIEMPPAAVALASALCIFGTRPEGRFLPLPKFVFNAAQSCLAGGLAALTYRALGGVTSFDSDSLLPIVGATAAATGVYFIVNATSVSGVLAIANRASFVKTLLGSHAWHATSYAAFCASGIFLAALYESVGVVALPLLLVSLLVARNAFHAYQEVSEAYDSTVRAIVRAIDAKDAYTRGHSERVADYARLLAERTGMSERDLEVFYFGALLHDVGKVAVRKSTLTKPSRLDPFEWEEIKRHPVLGAEIVKEIEFLEPALDSVLYHHERLNGSGYPVGLKGDMVTPWSRMLAIADTYDAMTSGRSYRASAGHAEAVAELRKCSRTLYDPVYVEAFIAALEEAKPELLIEPIIESPPADESANGATDATLVVPSPVG